MIFKMQGEPLTDQQKAKLSELQQLVHQCALVAHDLERDGLADWVVVNSAGNAYTVVVTIGRPMPKIEYNH